MYNLTATKELCWKKITLKTISQFKRSCLAKGEPFIAPISFQIMNYFVWIHPLLLYVGIQSSVFGNDSL
jgi:hypothetical protein